MFQELKEKIKSIPADYAEIHYEEYYSTRISYSNSNVEAISTSKTAAGNVRVLIDGGWGFASFNNMDIDKSIAAALENAQIIKTHRSDGKSLIYQNPHPIIKHIETSFQISPDSLTLKDKNEIAYQYNERLKHPKITSTRVTYSDWKADKFFVNSEGSAISQSKVFTGISIGAMAKDGSNIQQAYESVGQYGGLELVYGLENNIDMVQKRAIDLLKANKVDSGEYTVILDPNLAGVFAHEAFGHLSESDFLYENPRMQEVMVIGREFGPGFLNIIDDGGIEGLAGYTPYDDEGIPAEKSYLIKSGKLNSRLHSRETAAKMNEKPSGNARAIGPSYQPIVRMTNTYIDKGEQSFEQMLSGVKDGIYAIDYLGGMTNLEMFTFSAGYAYRIRDGKVCELLRDVVLSGNVFSTLKNIAAVGNDLEHHGGLGGCGKAGQSGLPVSTGSPHILINHVLIGGN